MLQTRNMPCVLGTAACHPRYPQGKDASDERWHLAMTGERAHHAMHDR
jgi:hypothetical protein